MNSTPFDDFEEVKPATVVAEPKVQEYKWIDIHFDKEKCDVLLNALASAKTWPEKCNIAAECYHAICEQGRLGDPKDMRLIVAAKAVYAAQDEVNAKQRAKYAEAQLKKGRVIKPRGAGAGGNTPRGLVTNAIFKNKALKESY